MEEEEQENIQKYNRRDASWFQAVISMRSHTKTNTVAMEEEIL